MFAAKKKRYEKRSMGQSSRILPQLITAPSTKQLSSAVLSQFVAQSAKSNHLLPTKKKIYVWYVIESITEIDTAAQSFDARFTIECTWDEPLLNDNLIGETDALLAACWKPRRVKFLNEVESDYTSNLEVVTLKNNQKAVRLIISGQARFLTKMSLRMFPFDFQDLTISFTLLSRNQEIEFVQDKERESTIQHSNIVTSEWIVQKPRIETVGSKDSKTPVVQIHCRMERVPRYYILNVIIPFFIITNLTWCGYTVEQTNTGSRLQTILIMVLTAVTFKFVVAGSLPTISYSTLIDTYILFGIFMQCAIAFHVGGMSILRENDPTWVLHTGIPFLILISWTLLHFYFVIIIVRHHNYKNVNLTKCNPIAVLEIGDLVRKPTLRFKKQVLKRKLTNRLSEHAPKKLTHKVSRMFCQSMLNLSYRRHGKPSGFPESNERSSQKLESAHTRLGNRKSLWIGS